jgi:putative hydrolase of the HAD superfamily
MIKGVFLDLGWTIFRPARSDWFINEKVLEFAPLEVIQNLPQDERGAAFDIAIKYLDDHHTLFTEDEEIEQFKEFYTIIASDLPELGITPAQAEEIAVFKVHDTSNYLFFEKSKETLLLLREKYKLGIISDTWPSADRILRSGGVENFFDTKTYSCHLGTMMYVMSVNSTARGPRVSNSRFRKLGATLLVFSAFAILRYGFSLRMGQRNPYFFIRRRIFLMFI